MDTDNDSAASGSDSDDEPRIREKVEVTAADVTSCAKKAAKGVIPEMKKLLSMFRSAANPSGASLSGENDENANDEGRVSKYMISSPDIYEAVIVNVVDCIQQGLNQHLLVSSMTTAELSSLGKNPKWKKIQLLVLSFFKSMLHTLVGLSEHSKHSQVSVYLTDSLEKYVPYLAPLPRMTKGVVKVLLNLWCQTSANAEDDQLHSRSHAFLRIRQIAIALPGAAAEECMRSMYLKYARESRSYTELNAASTVFMAQCVAELYVVDPTIAYQQAFLYIRQLALHVRSAFLRKSQETTRQITSWQFMNCIRLWTRVICTMPSSTSGIGALAFPLSQVIFGVMAAAPSIYFTPLKFHLFHCLHQIAAHCQLFIPTTAKLLEILESPELVGKPAASTELPPKLQYLVKLPANSMAKVVVRDAVVQELISLLRQDMEIYRYHVGFPEYSYLPIRRLKAFAKKSKVAKCRDLARALASQLEQQAELVKKKRVELGKTPMSITDFEPLLTPSIQPARIRLMQLSKDRGLLQDTKNSAANAALESRAVDSTSSKGLLKDTFGLSRQKKQKKVKIAAQSDEESDGTVEDDEDFDGASGDEDGSIGDMDDEDSVMEFDDEEAKPIVKGNSKKSKNDKKTKKKKKSVEILESTDHLEDEVEALNWDDDE